MSNLPSCLLSETEKIYSFLRRYKLDPALFVTTEGSRIEGIVVGVFRTEYEEIWRWHVQCHAHETVPEDYFLNHEDILQIIAPNGQIIYTK
jgi:hypothetical protein